MEKKLILLALLGLSNAITTQKRSQIIFDSNLMQQEALMRIGKWTDMDTEIRNQESDILFGADFANKQCKEGKCTRLTGYNNEYDAQVDPIKQAGDPAMDDDYLRKTFHKYYQYGKDKDGNILKDKSERILSRDYAWLASKEIVQKWNHMDDKQAEDFLNENFEGAWRAADVNNDGKIKLNEAYTFEKSLMGSFAITYTD